MSEFMKIVAESILDAKKAEEAANKYSEKKKADDLMRQLKEAQERAERAEREAKEAKENAAKEARERAAREARETREKEEKERLRRTYDIWTRSCENSVRDMKSLVAFPHPPIQHCKCEDVSCAFQKLGDHGLKICVHDLETLLRVDLAYSTIWLEKMRRLYWHSDKWSYAPIDVRKDFKAKADEMFKLYGLLIAKG